MNDHVHEAFRPALNGMSTLTHQQIQRERYLTLLRDHDWSYEYSDDHGVWSRGHAQRMELTRLQRSIDPEYVLWNEAAPTDYRIQRSA